MKDKDLEIEQLKAQIKILLLDIDDLHKEREERVEVVYADFMKDYKIMRNELDECQNACVRAENRIVELEKLLDAKEVRYD